MKLALLALLFSFVSSSTRPIELQVSPRVCSCAHTDVRIRIRVHAAEDDRWISVAIDNGAFRRSSFWNIEPDRTLYNVYWRDVPAGDYEVVAAIGRGDRQRASDRQTVTYVGFGGNK